MLHRQQFCILRDRADLPGYKSIDLEDGWVLSYHEELPLFFDEPSQTALLGYAWQVMPGREAPEKELEKLAREGGGRISEKSLMDAEETWNGRYAVISGGRIYLDAGGMLNVFYSAAGASSDCLLLARAMGLSEKIYEPGRMNWMPGPRTHYEGISRLMPSQVYDLGTGTVHARELLPTAFVSGGSEQELTAAFIDHFCYSLRQMADLFPEHRLMAALTGGHDSRALTALAKKAGTDFMAYTMEYDGISKGDVEIPPQICAVLGLDHVYVRRNKSNYSAQREKEYDRYTCGLVRDEDRLYYAYDQFRELTEAYGKCVLLRSGIWPDLCCVYSRFFEDGRPGQELFQEYHIGTGSPEWESLQEYFSWCSRNPVKTPDPANRFYYEERSGCWLASIENGFTMIDDIISLEPLNCRLLLSILAAYDEECRMSRRPQMMIADAACPELAEIPYENGRAYGESFLTSIRMKADRALDRMRHMGFRRAASFYARTIRKHFRIWKDRRGRRQSDGQFR